jgi:P27 family predicted phage terminase small subunit
MGIPGTKPEPNTLKLIKGNPGKRPITPAPQPTPVAPKPPSWLPSIAKKEWKRLSPELERLGLLTAVDGLTFGLMLFHFAMAAEDVKELKQIQRELKAEGKKQHPLIATDEMKMPRKHPLHQIIRDHSAAFKAYMAEFGLSPSSRTRLQVKEPEGADEFF